MRCDDTNHYTYTKPNTYKAYPRYKAYKIYTLKATMSHTRPPLLT